MSTNPVSSQEKKLKTLRKILLTVFVGIAIPSILLLIGMVLPAITGRAMEASSRATIAAPFITIGAIMIGGLATILLVIYHIFKYRLEKDDELFP